MKNTNGKVLKNIVISRLFVLLVCVATITVNLTAQDKYKFDASTSKNDSSQTSSALTPITFAGTPNCATLNASNDPIFARITMDWELKFNQASPNGTFTYTDGANRQLEGPSDPYNSVTITSSATVVNFSSTKEITAVIVEGNVNSKVYNYPSGTFGDTGLVSPSSNGGSHLTFCYCDQLSPTAAPAMLSGRIRDVNGKPVAHVFVEVTNLSSGETVVAQTNLFGRYTFEDLPTGEEYQIRVHSNRYIFNPDTTVVSLAQDLTSADFVARTKGGMMELNR